MESSAENRDNSRRSARVGVRIAALTGALLSAGAFAAIAPATVLTEAGATSGHALDSVAVSTPWPGSTCCPGSN